MRMSMILQIWPYFNNLSSCYAICNLRFMGKEKWIIFMTVYRNFNTVLLLNIVTTFICKNYNIYNYICKEFDFSKIKKVSFFYYRKQFSLNFLCDISRIVFCKLFWLLDTYWNEYRGILVRRGFMRRRTMEYCRLIERRCFKLLSCCFESRVCVHKRVCSHAVLVRIQAPYRNAYVQLHKRLTYALIRSVNWTAWRSKLLTGRTIDEWRAIICAHRDCDKKGFY